MADGKGVSVADITPHDAEMERATLGAVLLIERWNDGLRLDLFHNPKTAAIAAFLLDMHQRGRTLDLVSVFSDLNEAHQSPDCPPDLRLIRFPELAVLPNLCPSPESLPGWIVRLRELRHKRALWRWSQEIRAAAAAGDYDRLERLQKSAPRPQEETAEPAGRIVGLPDAGAPRASVKRALHGLEKRGASARTMAAEILRTDTRWKDVLWYDDFRKIRMLADRAWSDHDDQRVAEWLARVYRVEISADSLRPILAAISDDHRRDPLNEWLRGLRWDGVERIDTWLQWGMGVVDSPINRWIGQAWLVQAVARALRPGCQADATLVLLGEQGEGKTSTLRQLVGGAFWSESKIDIGNVPRCYQQVAAAWVHELGEMSQFLGSKLDQNEAKNFLTSPSDSFTPLFGRSTVRWLRRSVFVGTTNRPEILRDPTGARRFLPVEVGVTGPVDQAAVVGQRDQLWAEAVARFDAGAEWWLPRARWGELREVQSDYQSGDAWGEAVEQWLREYATTIATPSGLDVLSVRETSEPVTTRVLLIKAIGKDLSAIHTADCARMGDILAGLGFRHRKVRHGSSVVNGYTKKPGVP